MRRVFVSHASEDKPSRVKPLAWALLIEGVSLWLDRPGVGDNHFGFSPDFVRRYSIAGLQAGTPFDRQILEAHWESVAVLGCLSRHLASHRQVLVQELVLAAYADKLVTCIVDDLPFSDVPADLGLIDGSRLQSPRIDTTALSAALSWLDARPGQSPDHLPAPLSGAWVGVRQIVAELDRVMSRRGTQRMGAAEARAARDQLLQLPIGPMVRPHEIPWEVVTGFADALADPDRSRLHLRLAMELVLACNVEAFGPRQIVVSQGEVMSPDKNPAELYWADVLTIAGTKSRRTLGALLLAPTAPRQEHLPPSMAEVFREFLGWLRGSAFATPIAASPHS